MTVRTHMLFLAPPPAIVQHVSAYPEIAAYYQEHRETNIVAEPIGNIDLEPDDTVSILKFDPAEGGAYYVEAYRVVDEVSRLPIQHTFYGALYVRGGDRYGIGAMNFDIVYNASGYIIGLAGDVECQALIRNAHTYPPQRDCWNHLVVFDPEVPYNVVDGVDGITAYLLTDFDFYTWPKPDENITRRIHIIRRHREWEGETYETFHIILLAVVGFDGRYDYSFDYDVGNGRYALLWQRAHHEGTITSLDYFGNRNEVYEGDTSE